MDKTEQVVYQGTEVASDANTKAKLYDWFQFREINCHDEDRFVTYYKRNLNLFYPKYLLLLEDELDEIPELVNFKTEITGQLRNYGSVTDQILRKILRENERTDDLTRTTDMSRKDTGTISNAETDVLQGNARNDDHLVESINSSSNSVSTDVSSTNSTGSTDTEGHDDSRGMVRQLPQSSEYAAGGFPNTLDWSTGTQQAQDKVDTTSHGSTENNSETESEGETETSNESKRDNTGYSTSSTTQNNQIDRTQTNNTQSKDEGTVRDTGTQNNSEKVDEDTSNVRSLDDKHDSFTTERGLKNMTEVELRDKIWGFISNSIALQWFLAKMDCCFIGVFD